VYTQNPYPMDNPFEIYVRRKISQWADVIRQERQDYYSDEMSLASQYILRQTRGSLGNELLADYEFEANKICDYINQYSKTGETITKDVELANLVIGLLEIKAASLLYDALIWACSSKDTEWLSPILVIGGLGLLAFAIFSIFGEKKKS